MNITIQFGQSRVEVLRIGSGITLTTEKGTVHLTVTEAREVAAMLEAVARSAESRIE